jgi:hypothetical protein
MIVAVEIIVGSELSPGVARAADVLAEACAARGFSVKHLAEPGRQDNRLCLYLSTADAGYDVTRLLDVGVRRDAFARLGHAQYLVRSWRGDARLHVAMAARTELALVEAARWVADRIIGQDDFSHLDLQGPPAVEHSE